MFVVGILVGLSATGDVLGGSLTIPPSTGVSVELWIMPTEGAQPGTLLREMGIFSKGGRPGPNEGIGMYVQANSVLHGIFVFENQGIKDISRTGMRLSPGLWNQVGMEFDGNSQMKVWLVDGEFGEYFEQVSYLTSPDSIKNSTWHMYIGYIPGDWVSSPFADARIDEFTMKIGGTTVVQLDMNEMTGIHANDSSGFDNYGTFINYGAAPQWVSGHADGGVYVTQGAVRVLDEPFVAGRIYGTVSLQGRTDNSGLVTFELRQPGATTLVEYDPDIDISGTDSGIQVILPSSGAYELPLTPVGTFDLAVKTLGYLRAVQAGITVEDTTEDGVIYDGGTVANVQLKGGDINNTNSVNIQDLNVLKANYGKSGAQ
jgi:hypothetical protein